MHLPSRFKSCFLPHAKRLPGRKVLIADNLSSHIDEEVLNLCRNNERSVVCLVANSTHLCQPLYVVFFRPIKVTWRKILSEWKLQNLCVASVLKPTFPCLLRKSLEALDKIQTFFTQQFKKRVRSK